MSGVSSTCLSWVNPDSQLRLAIVYILKMKPGDSIAWFAMKCSSMVHMNVGTSRRCPSNAAGDPTVRSVAESNCLLERNLGYDSSVIFVVGKVDKMLISWCISFPHDSSQPRTICLMMLVTAVGGVWCLEQPFSSVLELYPAFLHMMTSHYRFFETTESVPVLCSVFVYWSMMTFFWMSS